MTAKIEDCPTCGEPYEEEGATDRRWVASCYRHDEPVNWDTKTGELIPGWL